MLLPTLLLKSINAVIILCLYKKKRNDISCIIEQYQDTQPFKKNCKMQTLWQIFQLNVKKNWLGQTSWPRYKILIFVFFSTFENILLVLHFITNCQSTIHSLTKLILILYSLLLLL